MRKQTRRSLITDDNDLRRWMLEIMVRNTVKGTERMKVAMYKCFDGRAAREEFIAIASSVAFCATAANRLLSDKEFVLREYDIKRFSETMRAEARLSASGPANPLQ